MNIPEMEAVCKQVRRDIITMTAAAGSGHPGGSLSATEILVALYYDLMKVDPKNPNDPARDRLVLSKGHAAPALYAVLGDGELQEGIVWEAAMSAAHYKLDNLTFIVDNNGLQIDGTNDQVMGLGNIAQKFTAFGFHVIEVADGNDLRQVLDALHQPAEKDVPTCILCHTVKGKGVSCMENQVGWHGKAPNAEQRDQALKELEA